MFARPEDFLIYQIMANTVAKVPDLASESILVPIREKASGVAIMTDRRSMLVIDCKQPLTGGAAASRVWNDKKRKSFKTEGQIQDRKDKAQIAKQLQKRSCCRRKL